MIGFEPGSSGIGSDRSANCATTTALQRIYLSDLIRSITQEVSPTVLLILTEFLFFSTYLMIIVVEASIKSAT